MLGARAVAALCAAALIVIVSGCSDEETGSAEELCAAVGDGGQSFDATFEGFDPTDTDTALEQLRAARVRLGELRDVAPSEVRGDLTEEIDYLQALIAALEEVGPNDPAAAVRRVQQTADEHPDVQQAADRLEAWTETSC